jgi:hypothetical protein
MEVVVLRADEVVADTSRLLLDRLATAGRVRVISAVQARHEADGVISVDEWTKADDTFDLMADLTAHELGLDRRTVISMTAGLPIGATLLVLLIEHRWLQDITVELDAVGGEVVASAMLADEWLHRMERDLLTDE